ncbi:cytochrome c oxidase subunit 5B, mitochondrial-like [Culicoides brevitarsis]|uniref:cytochrome c oxidase subunit 5B, mitochondrial-like n=1 Tax=Culicoides brevitarsis TaxID=469753 RepID=UPI00307C0168
MASLCGRLVLNAARRNVTYTSVRFCKSTSMGDPLDHATGIEKRELLAKLAGNDDPFMMKIMKRGPGTKENPNCIPSAFEARLIGCICEEDQIRIQWMWLHQGQEKRCECGHWFKLVEKTPV